MKKTLLLLTILVSLNCESQNEKKSPEINVLFIGNSLTYSNNMPEMLQKMMNETNPNIKIDHITFPGMSLDAHLNTIIESQAGDNLKTRSKKPDEISVTEKKIKERDWDIIILQTGGVSVLIPESVQFKINPAIEQIKSMASTNTRLFLFNTWATKIEYPEKFCYRGIQIDPSLERMEEFCSPVLKDENDYLFNLNSSYESIAKNLGLERTNHGDIFQRVFDKNPDLEILEDDMHPSNLGAFLSASIFYKMITKNDASELEYTADLDPKKAEALKRFAK
jgi:hypothetical protein